MSTAADTPDAEGTAGAQAPQEGLGLGRVASRSWGYRVADVDALLLPLLGSGPGDDEPDDSVLPEPETLRTATFRRQRGGYIPAEVDAAIDRLEDRAAAAHARRRQAEDGPQAWDDGMDRRLEQIYGRLRRPSGHRFRAPSSASTRGYSARQVDELCETVLTEIDRQQAPDADMIRRAVFDPAYGQDVYEENQVDAFLDALVDLVLTLD